MKKPSSSLFEHLFVILPICSNFFRGSIYSIIWEIGYFLLEGHLEVIFSNLLFLLIFSKKALGGHFREINTVEYIGRPLFWASIGRVLINAKKGLRSHFKRIFHLRAQKHPFAA